MRGEPAARCPTRAVALRLTSACRGSACASPGSSSRPPRAPRQLSAWQNATPSSPTRVIGSSRGCRATLSAVSAGVSRQCDSERELPRGTKAIAPGDVFALDVGRRLRKPEVSDGSPCGVVGRATLGVSARAEPSGLSNQFVATGVLSDEHGLRRGRPMGSSWRRQATACRYMDGATSSEASASVTCMS